MKKCDKATDTVSMLYLPYVRTTKYLRRKTAQTQRAITSRIANIL
jgi:hypothetical protein